MGELGGNALSILPVAASTFETNRAAALLARASRSARVKYVVAHGHQVASHTWAHLVSSRLRLSLFKKVDRVS